MGGKAHVHDTKSKNPLALLHAFALPVVQLGLLARGSSSSTVGSSGTAAGHTQALSMKVASVPSQQIAHSYWAEVTLLIAAKTSADENYLNI